MAAENNQEQVPNKFADFIDAIIRSIGHFFMWANILLIAVIILQVVLRYGFGHGLVLLEELQWHLYALGIMFGASYAIMMDSHIRVDIIHARLSQKWRNRWDLFGIVFLLLPFAIMVFHQSLDFVYESWRVNERSDAVQNQLKHFQLPAQFRFMRVTVNVFSLYPFDTSFSQTI